MQCYQILFDTLLEVTLGAAAAHTKLGAADLVAPLFLSRVVSRVIKNHNYKKNRIALGSQTVCARHVHQAS